MAPRDTDSSLEIRAPKRFAHVGSLKASEVAHDPRSERFSFDNVTTDLRECRHIDIPAILWCVVFLSLAVRRGANCQLRLPENADKKRTWNDWSSIEYATVELVSGTGDPHRGIGLFGAAEDSRLPGAVLRIISGRGALHINEQSQIRAICNNLFPGTLVYISIPFPVV